MLITRSNLKGGRPLEGYRLHTVDGYIAYPLGYCAGCGEKVGVRQTEIRELVDFFGLTEMRFKKLVDRFQPKTTFREWLIRWLGGDSKTVDNY